MSQLPVVMAIDEDPAYRDEIEAIITGARMGVAPSAGYGVEAASLAQEHHPDVILVAVDEPPARALQTIESIRAILPATPILAYSGNTEFRFLRKVIQAGVRDILSKPLRPSEVVNAINAALAASGRDSDALAAAPVAGTVLTVFGAKGGVGKTTLTTNLAAALASDTGSSVLVIDLDTRFGDVAIMLDLVPQKTLADVAPLAASITREGFRDALTPHESGAMVLAAPAHPNDWRSISPDDVAAVIQLGARMFDYVLLDTPGAFNDIVGVAIEAARQVLMVTSVDIASIKDTSFVLDVLEGEAYPDDRIFVTVNHVQPGKTLSRTDIERVLARPVFWEIPNDRGVGVAGQIGKPIVLAKPKSPAARSIRTLARRISGGPEQPVVRRRPRLRPPRFRPHRLALPNPLSSLLR